jgi:hypothetical protein
VTMLHSLTVSVDFKVDQTFGERQAQTLLLPVRYQHDLERLGRDVEELLEFAHDCKVVGRLVLGGLHHEYRLERIAARETNGGEGAAL